MSLNDVTTRDVDYWESAYETGVPHWDKGQPAPPLVRVIKKARLPEGTRVLVPGCGFGHEVLFLAQAGCEVTAVDFAPSAIQRVRERARGLPITALERDIFSLSEELADRFDLVVEHTCFCAIPIEMRDAYADVMSEVLVEKGQIIGLFYETDNQDGPPFKTTVADVQRHFSRYFDILKVSRPKDSFENRRGKEWLITLRKR